MLTFMSDRIFTLLVVLFWDKHQLVVKRRE